MERRTFGKTGVQLSILGFGSMHLEASPQAEVNRVLARAVDLGVNVFHTDYNYGTCVEKLGHALHAFGSRRDDLFLIAGGHPANGARFHAEFDGMFRRLGLAHIDLFLLSGVSDEERLTQVLAPGGALEVLRKEREAGHIRFIGASSHGNGALVQELVDLAQLDAIMVPYNFSGFHLESWGRLPVPAFHDLDEPLNRAHSRGMGVFVIKVLAGGLLSQVPPAHVQGLVSRPPAIDPALAIRHVLSKQFVTSAVLGMTNRREVEENTCWAANPAPLSLEETATAEAAVVDMFAQYCVRCGLCSPCPENIDIPQVFRLEYRVLHYPLAWARESAAEKWQALPAKPAACTDCGVCLPRCPYHLPIPALLRAAESKIDAVGGMAGHG